MGIETIEIKKYGNLEFGNPNILFWEGVIWESEFRTSQKTKFQK